MLVLLVDSTVLRGDAADQCLTGPCGHALHATCQLLTANSLSAAALRRRACCAAAAQQSFCISLHSFGAAVVCHIACEHLYDHDPIWWLYYTDERVITYNVICMHMTDYIGSF